METQTKAGRPFTYTAEQIAKAYNDYCVFMSTQYDIKIDFIKSGERAGEPIEIKLPKIKSIEGFCLFIDMNPKTFYNYLNAESSNIDDALLHTITRIRTELMEIRKSLALNNIINPQFLMAIDGYKQNVELNQNVTVNALPVQIANSVIDLTDFEYKILENE